MKKLGIMLAVAAMVFVGTATYAQSTAPAQKAKTEKTATEKKAHKGTHKHHHHAGKKAQKPAESNK
ncbi:hypothetical protein [Chitinophaga sp. CB10]|uniref:hypothetical protein n=1 Tax=Chitinophaga sp. CB10 TaxID=1891659 RepID=UPI0025BF8584|nr:hypothetical protein [Chitinophaga sp. CB10]